MYCTNCGQPRRGHARFCSNCGFKFSDAGPISPAATVDPTTASTIAFRPQDVPRPAEYGTQVVAEGPLAGMAPPAMTAPATMPPGVIPLPTAPAKPRHKYYRPGPLEFGITAVATVLGIAASILPARASGALGYWTVGRITGFVTYGLLTVAVSLGIFLSLRHGKIDRAFRIAERAHPIVMLIAGSILINHVVGFLLIGFPLYSAVIPFTTTFRPLSIGAGAISLWIGLFLFISTYFIRKIGYGTWRTIHYLGFLAWVLALVHGVASGHDSRSLPIIAIYLAGVLLVGGLLTARLASYVASLRPPALSPAVQEVVNRP